MNMRSIVRIDIIALIAGLAALGFLLIIASAARAAEAGAATRLDEPTRDALESALADGRNSKAFYEAVMKRHGRIAPFTNIANAEAKQALALERIFERYDMNVPEPGEPGEFAVPDTVAESCAAAAAAERENAALYESFLPEVDRPDIRRTFVKLRTVSLENHLPAFENCAAGGKGYAQFAPGACAGGCGMGEAACGCGKAAAPAEPKRAGGCGCAQRRAARQAQQAK